MVTRNFLIEFLRDVLKADPMHRQDLVDEYTVRLDELIAEIQVSA